MNGIPCTQCGKCVAICPMELDIPGLMAAYNRIAEENADEGDVFVCSRFHARNTAPSLCVGCGHCMFTCPEGIGIPAIMHELTLLDR